MAEAQNDTTSVTGRETTTDAAPMIDVLADVCRHFRNKKMSYLPLAQAIQPGPEGGDSRSIGSGSHHWCSHTQHPFGPDGGFVSLTDCAPGRKCHCPY